MSMASLCAANNGWEGYAPRVKPCVAFPHDLVAGGSKATNSRQSEGLWAGLNCGKGHS